METYRVPGMARKLMNQHGLGHWIFEWSNRKGAAGDCSHSRSRIRLSEPWVAVNSEEHVVDVMLHEIAHALVGKGHGHDAVWRAMARRVGCTGTRCTSDDSVNVRGKWMLECPACYYRAFYHRRPSKTWLHGKCDKVSGAKPVMVLKPTPRAYLTMAS